MHACLGLATILSSTSTNCLHKYTMTSSTVVSSTENHYSHHWQRVSTDFKSKPVDSLLSLDALSRLLVRFSASWLARSAAGGTSSFLRSATWLQYWIGVLMTHSWLQVLSRARLQHIHAYLLLGFKSQLRSDWISQKYTALSQTARNKPSLPF